MVVHPHSHVMHALVIVMPIQIVKLPILEVALNWHGGALKWHGVAFGILSNVAVYFLFMCFRPREAYCVYVFRPIGRGVSSKIILSIYANHS